MRHIDIHNNQYFGMTWNQFTAFLVLTTITILGIAFTTATIVSLPSTSFERWDKEYRACLDSGYSKNICLVYMGNTQ